MPKRYRWKRWVVLAAGALLLGGFGRFAYLRIARRPTPRLDYWTAIHTALDPAPPGAWKTKDVDDLLTDRPWESDPALVAAARPVGSANTTTRPFEVSDLLEGTWDPKRPDIAAVDTIFRSDEFKANRSKMDRATRAGWQHAMAPTYRSLLPQLSPARQWARWLAAHSRWALESVGDVKMAEEDWLMILRLGRQIRRTQCLISWLVEASCISLTAGEMMLAAPLAAGRLDVAALAREVDAVLGPPPRPRDILASEHILMQSYLEEIYVREGGDWMDVSAAAGGLMTQMGGPNSSPPSRLWNLLSPLFHSLPEARRRIDRHFARYDACTDLVACEKLREDYLVLGPDGITALDGFPGGPPTVRHGTAICYRARCDMEAALTMLAIEAYRRDAGRYPGKLEDLLPRYLPRLPIDYADRKPLRYRRDNDGYLLYSIGSDGRDDGGRTARTDRPRSYDENPDVVFTRNRRAELAP